MPIWMLMTGPAQEGGQAPNFMVTMLPFIVIMVIFYFLIMRPKQQEQKRHETMLTALKKGDRVLTSGGLFGTVVGVKENVVVLKIADNVKAEFQLSSVQVVVSK